MDEYESRHTGPEIDDSVDRAKAGGAIDQALANKAPAGYGLGEGAKYLTSADDLDSITANGWYWWYDTRPAGALYNYCHMRVDNGYTGANTSVMQTIYRNEVNTVMRRYYAGGAWITEWDTPEMVLGVEYRTTERYNGKPVYTMAVDFGALPVDTYKIVGHNIANVDCMLSACGVIPEAGTQIPGKSVLNGYWNNDTDVLADRSNIQVVTRNCNDSMKNGGWTARITLRYTKTTD